MKYHALKRAVGNRGVPPDSFLDELIAWGKSAPEHIFAPSNNADVYGNVKAALGPWKGLPHRRAVILEVLRVLAGFESAWKWTEGRDVTNATSGTVLTEETGIFQVSFNATYFDPSLKTFVADTIKSVAPSKFTLEMKRNHPFAIEFAARLLRFTVNHNGPVKRHEIDRWLSREAVAEFETLLS